ncbi:MAG: hypothetical protein JWO15_1606 [Sphingomonadales bacterium]|nr:hypothetical protein [Sphingomonadales bacterium]
MLSSEQETCAHFANTTDTKASQVRSLNDGLRQDGRGGRFVITNGINALGLPAVAGIIGKLRSFDDFSADNDPHGEHDMGAFEWEGIRILWKIDYYDKRLEYGSSDPADAAFTTRVLTIMLTSEY